MSINNLQDHDKQFVQHWLSKIAEVVTFEVGGYYDFEKDHAALAWTERQFEEDTVESTSESILGRSIIHISGELYCDLLLGKHLSAEDVVMKRFFMANILLHELGHALWFAVTQRDGEDTFEDSTRAEAGYSFVAHLFGKVTYPSWDLKSMMRWWPLGGKPYQGDNVLVGSAYVDLLFTDHFWNDNFPCGGDVGIIAWDLQNDARNGYSKPYGIPKSIWDLLTSLQPVEDCMHE